MNIDFKGKVCLVLAPHTDDGEPDCGGTIHKRIQQNAEAFCAMVSYSLQAK